MDEQMEIHATSPLTVDERRDFEHLEARVQERYDTCKRNVKEIARDLREIKRRLLYRDDYVSWEDYVRRRWHFGRRRANQILHAAEVIDRSGTVVPVQAGNSGWVPANERQARALTAIPEERRAAVVAEAARQADKRGVPITSSTLVVAERRLASRNPGPYIARDEAIEECADACYRAARRTLKDDGAALRVRDAVARALAEWREDTLGASDQAGMTKSKVEAMIDELCAADERDKLARA